MRVRRNKQRKILLIAMGIIFLTAGWVYFAYAAEPMMKGQGTMDSNSMMMHKGMMDGNDMMHKGMMHKGMAGMCPMHMMMAQHVMKKEIVATSDGGVVVMYDRKLLKYDKDLNFVKEAELKIDVNEMKAKLQQMSKECAENCQVQQEQSSMGGYGGSQASASDAETKFMRLQVGE
jgi:hypothetical protein